MNSPCVEASGVGRLYLNDGEHDNTVTPHSSLGGLPPAPMAVSPKLEMHQKLPRFEYAVKDTHDVRMGKK